MAKQMIPGAHPNRKVVHKTVMQQNVTVKNPQPVQVTLKDKDSRDYGHNKAGTGTVSKFHKHLSIATQEVPGAGAGIQQLTDYIKKLDPDNTSGAIKPALDIMDKLLKQGASSNPLGSIPGILGGLMGQLQQFLQQQNQQQQQMPPQCPKGFKWQANTSSCVIDPTQIQLQAGV